MARKNFILSKLLLTICFSLAIFSSKNILAQISIKGEPHSFSHKKYQKPAPIFYPKNINLRELIKQEQQQEDRFNPKIGKLIPMNIDILKSGEWTNTDQGRYCRAEIKLTKANALGLIFDEFYLPEGAKLHIYSPNHAQVLGAYSSINNNESKVFSAELLIGDRAIVEYFEPTKVNNTASLKLGEVTYVYADLPGYIQSSYRNRDVSGPCQVNINCPEGQPWQNQKNGVIKILLYEQGSAWWCTGSLINNTRVDMHPYLLTADHCGATSTTSEYNKWVFYFMDESPSCENAYPGTAHTLTGTKLLACSGDLSTGTSDYKLLELNDGNLIPSEYKPYFNGWDRSGNEAQNGVCIHHPSGDIKKISSYFQTISSYYDEDVSPIIPSDGKRKYWAVHWKETESGHGVTEGGSSGSPLFSENGYIIGTLSGGYASCSYPEEVDYYGKLDSHWEDQTKGKGSKLATYLDPINKGILKLNGTYGDSSTIDDLESEKANKRSCDISIFPNPAKGHLKVKLKANEVIDSEISLMNLVGKIIQTQHSFLNTNEEKTIDFNVEDLDSGIYFIRISSDQETSTQKVMIN